MPATVSQIVAIGRRKFGTDKQVLDKQYEEKQFSKFLSLARTYRKDGAKPTEKMLISKEVLEKDGRITEEGTHFELLNKNGKYADMWNKQAEKYIREDLVH